MKLGLNFRKKLNAVKSFKKGKKEKKKTKKEKKKIKEKKKKRKAFFLILSNELKD